MHTQTALSFESLPACTVSTADAFAVTVVGRRPALATPVSVPIHERLRGGAVRLLLSLQLRRLQQGPGALRRSGLVVCVCVV